MGRVARSCYFNGKKDLKIEGLKPFAEGRVRITNRKNGKTFESAKPMRAFIDSGASNSLLPMGSLKELDAMIGPFNAIPARVVTGNGLKDVLMLRDVKICVDHCCYHGDVLVTDETPGDIMLGMDFLSQSKAKIDFDKSTLVCGVGQKSVKLRLEE